MFYVRTTSLLSIFEWIEPSRGRLYRAVCLKYVRLEFSRVRGCMCTDCRNSLKLAFYSLWFIFNPLVSIIVSATRRRETKARLNKRHLVYPFRNVHSLEVKTSLAKRILPQRHEEASLQHVWLWVLSPCRRFFHLLYRITISICITVASFQIRVTFL